MGSLFNFGGWPPPALLNQLRSALIFAILIAIALIAGWLLGLLARILFTAVFSRRIENLSRWLGYKQLEQTLRLHVSLATLVGFAVQALVTGVALLLLASLYYPAEVQALLARGVIYLPTLLVALTLLFIGIFLSQVLADLAYTFVRAGKRGDANVISTIVRIGVVVLAVVASLLELGIATVFLTSLLVALLATAALALGLATGLGGADYVRDLLAGREVRSRLRPGQRIAIEEISGIVIECGTSATLIATDDGKRTLLPNKIITQKAVILG